MPDDPNESVVRRELTIPALDDYPLAATEYTSERRDGPAVAILGAMGVPQGFTGRYAAFLAGQGFRTVTFDYRGIGGSARHSARRSDARMRDWGELDIPGVIGWLRETGGPVAVVGYSAGGQLLGLAPNNHTVDGALLIASQSAFWRHWEGLGKVALWTLWHVVMPTAIRTLGFYPSRWFRMGENLPAGVAEEWSRWARQRRYLLDDETLEHRFTEFRGPLRAYSFSDDGYAPRRAVEALLSFYENAEIEHRHVHPSQAGLNSIGHFGFFRQDDDFALWYETADWLRSVGRSAS